MSYSVNDEAVLAAGSFWEAEDVFSRIHGVVTTDVGYAGGSTSDPNFHDVGDHVEAIRVYFDQRAISFEELIDTFWKIHDPTEEMNERYASKIFYLNEEQRRVAKKCILTKQENTKEQVLTTCEPLNRFWMAEDYHQHYLAKLRGEI